MPLGGARSPYGRLEQKKKKSLAFAGNPTAILRRRGSSVVIIPTAVSRLLMPELYLALGFDLFILHEF